MNEPLRPLTLSEILDRTAQLYRSRFLVFLGIGTIPAGTVFVFAAGAFAFFTWMGSNSRHGVTVADTLVWVFLILLVILAIPASLGASALGEAAMSEAAARLFLGDKITIRRAYKTAWKRGWRYIGLFILKGLVVVCAPAVMFMIGFVAMVAVKVSGVSTNDEVPSSPCSSSYSCSVWCIRRLDAAAPVPGVSRERRGTNHCVERTQAGHNP